MTRGPDWTTWVSLLGRLRRAPTDPEAWSDFVDHYGRRIYFWCRQRGLQEADSQDVTQEVLLRLATRMGGLAYDPTRSFRAWLKTVTQNALIDFVKHRQRPGVGTGDSQVLDLLANVAAQQDLLQKLDEEFDRELLEEAMARVRLRVEAHTWKAFQMLALQGLSGAEVARQLGMKVATAFVARSKVQRMLQEELQRLEGMGFATEDAVG